MGGWVCVGSEVGSGVGGVLVRGGWGGGVVEVNGQVWLGWVGWWCVGVGGWVMWWGWVGW